MRNTTARAALFLALVAPLAAPLVACDAPEPADAEFRVLPESLLWTDGDKGCDGVYMKVEEGTICAPFWYDTDACKSHQQFDICGHAIGYTPQKWYDACVHACFTSADCSPGMTCSQYGSCLWGGGMPPVEADNTNRATWNLCEKDDACEAGECIVASTGELCAPSCNDDSDCAGGPLNECSENAPTVCSDGRCKVPCDEFSQCYGIDGMTCDINFGECVWKTDDHPDSCGVGAPYGPCNDFGSCSQGYTCASRLDGDKFGWYCRPVENVCDAPEDLECAIGLGVNAPTVPKFPNPVLGCEVACETVKDCNNGAQCIKGACVW